MKYKMLQSKIYRTIFMKTWRPYIWIVVSAILIYGHVVFFSEYTYYDDDFLIKENFSKIDELGDIGQQFLEDVAHQGQGGNIYRPMLNVTFILSAQISGLELWGHYLVNVLLHVGACLFLFVLLLNLKLSRSISFISALLFTIHPALAQSVAWIAGRNDSLLAFFILPCFISFLKFISSSSYKWYLAHLFFFAMALFTKETTIIFPLILLFYLVFVNRKKVEKVQIIGLFGCWFVVLINWYILRIAARIAPFASPLTVIKNLLSDVWIVLFYFGKIFWPFNLGFGPLKPDVNILPGIISLLLLIGIIIFFSNRNWKNVIFGFLWFGLCIIPTLVYHPKVVIHVPYYEHRVYVPMIGIVILLLSLTFRKKIKFPKLLTPIFLTSVIVLFGWKSHCLTYHFQNFLTLRQYAAESSPHDKWLYSSIDRMKLTSDIKQQIHTYKMRSDAQTIDMEVDDSIKNCGRTRDILKTLENKFKDEPSDRELLHALAIANFARGFFVKSEQLFISAKTLDPQNADIPFNLGILYYDAHRYAQSEQEWLSAIKSNPVFGDAYLDLTYLYYQEGRFDLAWENCQQALKLGADVSGSLVKEIEGKRNTKKAERTS